MKQNFLFIAGRDVWGNSTGKRQVLPKSQSDVWLIQIAIFHILEHFFVQGGWGEGHVKWTYKRRNF